MVCNGHRRYYHNHDQTDHQEQHGREKVDHKKQDQEDAHDYYYTIEEYYGGDYEEPVVKVPSEPLPLPKPIDKKESHDHVEEKEKKKVDDLIIRVNQKPRTKTDEKKGQLVDLTELRALKDKKVIKVILILRE